VRKLLALLLVLLLGALGLWFLVGRDEPRPIVVEGSSLAEKPAHAPSAAAQLEKQPSDAAREVGARTVESPPNVARRAPADSNLAELKGRCLLPNGSAASGVSIQVHGWTANQERVIQHGVPDHWEDPNTTTDTDGRFSIRFDPPLAFQFVLDASTPGYAKASWRWIEIKPGEVKDLGDVQLLRGGTITGRIVAANGKVQKDGWSVHAQSAGGGSDLDRGGGRDTTREQAEIDPATGEFRLEDVPPGSTKLSAYSRIANWTDGPTVEVRAGEVIDATIRYAGPDNSARIVVVTFTKPFFVFSFQVGDILLRGPSLEPRRATKVAGSSQSFGFDDLPPGRYSVEINDPKFLPWSKDGVEPGTRVEAHLKGSAAVRLEIVDAQTSQPVAATSVKVRFDKVNFRPNEFLILEPGKKAPAGGLFDGLIPSDQTLIVSAEGYADCEVPAPDLKPNEVRPLRAAMTHGTRIAGRVVIGEARAPGADVDVELGDVRDGTGGLGGIGSDPKPGSHVRTDSDGRFVFSTVSPGKHTVRASISPLLAAQVEVDVSAGADKLDVELALPAHSYLAGRLIAPEGASFEGLSLFALPAADAHADVDEIAWEAGGDKVNAVAADGTFRIGPLALGEARVSLRLASATLPFGFHGSTRTQAATIDLGRVTIVAGAETKHDFDLRANFPGRIEVTLRVNGMPAPGPVIEVRDEKDSRSIEGAATAGPDGRAATNPLACKSYHLLVRAVDYAWFYLAPASVTVKPGELASTSIDVPLVEGVLQMLDDNGMAARVVKKMAIRSEDDDPLRPVATASISTDSDGRLQLKLPPGSYRLFSGEGFIKPGASSVRFDMTPTGPVPASVEIPR
jgi:hypothetical protein